VIKTADKRVLEALATLEHHGHFEAIMEWLEQSLADTSEQVMRERDEVETRRLQGAGSDLAEIINTAKNARHLLEK
jgi:hypothetical protein